MADVTDDVVKRDTSAAAAAAATHAHMQSYTASECVEVFRLSVCDSASVILREEAVRRRARASERASERLSAL